MTATTQRLAAIDIGTVTTRLLVADVDDTGRISEIARRSVITHLGEGWTASGTLSREGIARVAEAVGAFLTEARAFGVSRTLAVATSASRDAANSAELLDRLDQLGVRPHIISGEREARLTFAGATYGLTGEGLLVVDIGGGSTELVLGSSEQANGHRQVEVELSRSVDVGSRRVTELHLPSDPPTPGEREAAASWVAEELRSYFSAAKDRPREMIAVAGTATSLAAIDLALDPYDPARVHGYRLGGTAIAEMLDQLSSMTLEERRKVTGLEPERAGVIVGGALILQSVLAYAGLTSTLVSEHDILYGMVLALAAGETEW